MCLLSWRTWKLKRKAVGSNDAEVQSILEAEDQNFRVRMLWSESAVVCNGLSDRPTWSGWPSTKPALSVASSAEEGMTRLKAPCWGCRMCELHCKRSRYATIFDELDVTSGGWRPTMISPTPSPRSEAIVG